MPRFIVPTTFVFSFLLILAMFAVACGGGTAAPKDPTAGVDEKPSGGKIFRENCVTCHGADGQLGVNGAANLHLSNLPLEERVKVITNGRNLMTPFKSILNADEIAAVAEYTTTFK